MKKGIVIANLPKTKVHSAWLTINFNDPPCDLLVILWKREIPLLVRYIWGERRKMSVEKEIREEQKKKLSRMSTKEKLSYIWDYYKWHIIITVALLAISISLAKDIRHNKMPSFINVLMANASPYFDPENRLVSDIAEYGEVDLNSQRISVDSSILIDNDSTSPLAMGSAQKLLAMYAANEVDVMIAPESVIDFYLKTKIFADPLELLDEAQAKRLKDAGYEFYYRKLSEMTDPEEEEMPSEDREVCVGIIINNSSYLSEIGAYTGLEDKSGPPVIFTFAKGSEKKENAILFLNLLTGRP